jgi:hypothetical protein
MEHAGGYLDAAPVGSTQTQLDPRATMREARAKNYFEADLAGQRRWYGERASRFKARAQALGMIVVAAGAGTALLQVFGRAPWVAMLTALLGTIVALAEGWRQIARYDEAWSAYRQASERMKRERRLYVNGAGEYRDLGEEEEAFLHFIEAVEAIVAEEQQIYWKSRGYRSSPSSEASGPRQQSANTDAHRSA